jgi:insulysin
MNKIIKLNKPKYDDREFYAGVLDNNIKFAIINDQNLTRSYVTVSINIGSYADPEDYQGLAHFLEHMLFLGSKKYPDEKYFMTRLNELGGNTNAYTEALNTVYFFNVYDNGLEEMLDIFSRFFIDPIFNPDAVNREINAVNSEHNKNINSDGWIKNQLILELTNKGSVTNKFATGSLKTLNKPGIRDELINFHKKYYTNKNLSICVASSKNHIYIKQILNKSFGQIEDKKQHKLIINKPFFQENQAKIYHLKTLSNIYQVLYIWEIPKQDDYIYSQDFLLLAYILMNNSEKSLHFHLKNKGYLKNLSVSIQFEGILYIDLNLTKEGFANLAYIELVLFKNLDDIINTDFYNYAKYYKNVIKETFKYSKINTETLCEILANNHHIHKTDRILDGNYIIEIKSTDEYRKLFNKYISTDNYIKIISSQKYETSEKLKYNEVPEYNSTFAEITKKVFLVKQDIQTLTKNINVQLCCFDYNNQYLNLNTQIYNKLNKYDIPRLISKKQWYGANSNFGEPFILLSLQFNNEKYFNTPKNYILTKLSCSILNFIIDTVLFKPLEILCSISFEPNAALSNINLNITTLNDVDKLQIVMNEIYNILFNIQTYFDKVSDSHVKNLISTAKERYLNIIYLNPWEYSSYIIRFLSTDYSIHDLIKELDIVNYDIIKMYMKAIFINTALTTFVYGNIEINKAANLFNKMGFLFNNKVCPFPRINKLEHIILRHPNKQEKSHVITYFYKINKETFKKRILIHLLLSILSLTFFNELRTKNQLGYLVNMGSMSIHDHLYITQKVQSDKDINYVKKQIKHFNNNIIKYINESDFESFKETYKMQLMEPDNNLTERFARYYIQIISRKYLFNLNEILLKYLKNISKKDVIKFVNKYINKKNVKKVIILGNN